MGQALGQLDGLCAGVLGPSGGFGPGLSDFGDHVLNAIDITDMIDGQLDVNGALVDAPDSRDLPPRQMRRLNQAPGLDGPIDSVHRDNPPWCVTNDLSLVRHRKSPLPIGRSSFREEPFV